MDEDKFCKEKTRELLDIVAQEEKVHVEHVKGSGDEEPKRHSWIYYWKKHTGIAVPEKCPVCGCDLKESGEEGQNDKNLAVGGHVYIVNDRKKVEYVTPICKSCNGKVKEGVEGNVRFSVQRKYLVGFGILKEMDQEEAGK